MLVSSERAAHPGRAVDHSAYDADYYCYHCGPVPYSRSEPMWRDFFAKVAERIQETLAPRSVFDAGCAIGLLVEALRARGIEAFGRDISRYAIGQVPVQLQPYCACGSITDPIEGTFDLVTCIEVLEHMTPEDGARAVANLCAAAPLVLLSSSPIDVTEPTHVNVQPPTYWLRLFAEHGFGPRISADLSYITPWAMLLERRARRPSEAELDVFAQLVQARVKVAEDAQTSRAMLQQHLDEEVRAYERELRQRLDEFETDRARLITAHERALIDRVSAFEKELATLAADYDQGLQANPGQHQSAWTGSGASSGMMRGAALVQAPADIVEAHEHRLRERVRECREDLARLAEIHAHEMRAKAEHLFDSPKQLEELRARLAVLETSTAWRATYPVRRALSSFPMLRTLGRRGAKLAWWTVSGQLIRRLRQRSSTAAPLPLSAAATSLLGIDPHAADEHVIRVSRLFDDGWYLQQNPDVADFPGGPLRHFLLHGAREMRDPNPLFSIAWYHEQRPDVAESGMNPLLHYIRHGAAENVRPSRGFDPGWYRSAYADIAAAGVEPLAHYLHYGRSEGRQPVAPPVVRPLKAAALVTHKVPPRAPEIALLVTHAPGGVIKPHTVVYAEALRRHGLTVTLIIATETVYDIELQHVIDHVDGLYVRENAGFDFAAWAHTIQEIDFSDADAVYLLNDSIVGPIDDGAFDAVVQRIRSSHAHLLCLTDNNEIRHHFQSYFLVAKGEGVEALDDFLAGVRILPTKRDVIEAYEVPLLSYFENRGLAAEALFPARDDKNATIIHWRELVAAGCPFIKTAVLRDATNADWRTLLRERGYDTTLIDRTLEILKRAEQDDKRRTVPPIVLREIEEDAAIAVPNGLAHVEVPAGPVGVICHLFHADMAVSTYTYLSNIPTACNLHISTDTPEKARRIRNVFAGWSKGTLDIRVTQNRGRDIAPKLVAFADVYDRYEFVLHIHSKQSSHHPALRHWRDYLYSTLIGSEDIVRSILGMFAAEPRIGMVAPQHYEPMRRWANWGGNFGKAAGLAERMNLSLDEGAVLDFPSGSMFWARTAALRPLLHLGLSLDDFDVEAGQIDGTLAHAIERLYFFACEAAGLKWVKIADPHAFSGQSTFRSTDTPADLAAFLAHDAFRLTDNQAAPAHRPFPELDETPRAVLRSAERLVLGLERSGGHQRVAVGVVSYNNDAEQLHRCLRSALGAEILHLWDNGAPSELEPDLAARVAHGGGEGNLGFGAAHNRLMSQSFAQGADLYVTANPDGFFHPSALERISAMMAACGGLALIECTQFPVEHPKAFDPASLRTMWASGAALAISREAYQLIGGFDDAFFMYCEDVDISWRARAAGLDVLTCPTALFVHEVTNRQVSERTLRMIAESGVLLARKWGHRAFARWAAQQAPVPVDVTRSIQPVPSAWRDVADFEHGFSFSETRWS